MKAEETMAYHIPHREHAGSKWLTATLVSLYIIIAVLALLYGVDSSKGTDNRQHENSSQEKYSHSENSSR